MNNLECYLAYWSFKERQQWNFVGIMEELNWLDHIIWN